MLIACYDASNKPTIVDFNGTKYAYVHHLQGDIVAILDSNGNKAVEYKYDAWGKPFTPTGSMKDSPGKFNPCYIHDEETGLYYHRSRYYMPLCCRFISADDESVIDSTADASIENNLYTYCFNNPSNLDDVCGNWPDWLKKTVAAVAVVAVVAAVAVAVVATAGVGTAAMEKYLHSGTPNAEINFIGSGNVMKRDERRILKTFLHQSIPYEYKVYNQLQSLAFSTNQVMSYDLMYCYEELFDYAWTALYRPKVHQSIHCNFVGHQSEALSNEFIDYLDCLKKELPILVYYVDVMIEAIKVLQRLISPD